MLEKMPALFIWAYQWQWVNCYACARYIFPLVMQLLVNLPVANLCMSVMSLGYSEVWVYQLLFSLFDLQVDLQKPCNNLKPCTYLIISITSKNKISLMCLRNNQEHRDARGVILMQCVLNSWPTVQEILPVLWCTLRQLYNIFYCLWGLI